MSFIFLTLPFNSLAQVPSSIKLFVNHSKTNDWHHVALWYAQPSIPWCKLRNVHFKNV